MLNDSTWRSARPQPGRKSDRVPPGFPAGVGFVLGRMSPRSMLECSLLLQDSSVVAAPALRRHALRGIRAGCPAFANGSVPLLLRGFLGRVLLQPPDQPGPGWRKGFWSAPLGLSCRAVDVAASPRWPGRGGGEGCPQFEYPSRRLNIQPSRNLPVLSPQN